MPESGEYQQAPEYARPEWAQYRREARLWRDRMEREKATLLLERYRYRGYVRAGTLGTFMQRWGDFGRKWFGAKGELLRMLRYR